MPPVTDILKQEWDVKCIGCAMGAGDMIPPGGIIAENGACYVHQDPEVPLKGFLIVASRRHVQSIADFTSEEYADFSALLRLSRNALRPIPGILSVTLIQEETSGHFHLWLFPWYQWMVDQYGSTSLSHIRPIMASLRKDGTTPDQVREILDAVKILKQHAAPKN